MIRFVDGDDVTLDELIGELGSEGTCDVVVGGRTKQRALHRFAQSLNFPSCSGHNLDAIYELLDERAHAVTATGRDWTLVWAPSRHLIAEHPQDYARLVAVLADVADPPRRSTHGARGSRVVIVHGAALSAPAADPAARRCDSHATDPEGPDPHPTHQPGSGQQRPGVRPEPPPTPPRPTEPA